MLIDNLFKEALVKHPQEAKSHFEIVDPGVWRVYETGEISGLGEDWSGPFCFEIDGVCYEAFGLKNRVAESERMFLRDMGVPCCAKMSQHILWGVIVLVAVILFGWLIWCGTPHMLSLVFGDRHPTSLLHRWNFNRSLRDVVSGKSASWLGSAQLDWNEDGTAIRLPGGFEGSGGVVLGRDVLPTDGTAFTVEVWAAQRSVQRWSRIFEFGTSYKNMMNMCWTAGEFLDRDTFQVYQGFPHYVSTDKDRLLAPYQLGERYHISMVVEPNRDGDGITHFSFARRDVNTGNVLAVGEDKISPSWNIRELRGGILYLGCHNKHPNKTNDASADYDEVRVWRGALSDGQLTINAKNGPDKLPDRLFFRKDEADAEESGQKAVDELFALAEKRRLEGCRTVRQKKENAVSKPSVAVSAEDMYKRGMAYKRGDGVVHDFAKAFEWFKRGAEHGNAAAQLELGEAYERGRGVAKNEPESVKWYLTAGSRGHALACLRVGECYAIGRGVDANDYEAVKWFRKGSDLGNAHACFRLGSMYECGRGVNKDLNEARFWYKKSAALGNSYAVEALQKLP